MSSTNNQISVSGRDDTELWKEIAEFAKGHNSNRLLSATELPKWVLDIPTPSGLVLAADALHGSNAQPHELVGDVQALALVDLDKEGLAEYGAYAMQHQPQPPK